MRARVGKLEGQLEEARRAGKRQAAPFSRGEPKTQPRRSGRRSGEEHGRYGHREPPGMVDEKLDAPLAARCECGGEIEHERTEFQYQDELPEPRAVRRRFAVHIGKCRCCGRRHQGRQRFQSSPGLIDRALAARDAPTSPPSCGRPITRRVNSSPVALSKTAHVVCAACTSRPNQRIPLDMTSTSVGCGSTRRGAILGADITSPATCGECRFHGCQTKRSDHMDG